MPDPRIDAIRSCVAVERGPLVMCAESVDLPNERHVEDAVTLATEPTDVALIPYHQWANRGPSTMRVWLPNEPTSTDHQRRTQHQQTGSAR